MTPQEAKYILDSFNLRTNADNYDNQALDLGIKALEKQIPKKVKYKNRHGDGKDLYNKDYFHCPCCGRRLRNKQKDAHCGRCGQLLEWDGAE